MRPASSRSWDRVWLLFACIVPAVVYALSASREPASWDTAELQGVPYILGISHPTGFPFYVLLGYVWSHVIAFGTIALRMNIMSGVAVAITCGAAYAAARRFGASRAVALAATFWFAFTPNAWSHASRAEAQDLALMCSALALNAFLRWMDEGRNECFLAAFGLAGLGMAAHPNALWIVPALLAGTAIARRPSRAVLAGGLALTFAGLMLYAYLPLRSAYVAGHAIDPTATLADTNGGIFWNYNDPRTLHGLELELSGSESQTPAYFLASLNPVHLAAALQAFIAELRLQYGLLATILACVGLVAAWRRRWRPTMVLCIAVAAGLVFSIVYPNESDVERYRLLVCWVAVPFFGALTPQSRGRVAAIVRVLLVVLLAAGAAASFWNQRSFFRHAPAEGGRWVINAVRPYVPAKSVIVSRWLDATSLAYGAYVDGSLPGRIIVSDDKLQTGIYSIWARTRRVFVLADPHDVGTLPGTRDYARLDDYHELFEVQR